MFASDSVFEKEGEKELGRDIGMARCIYFIAKNINPVPSSYLNPKTYKALVVQNQTFKVRASSSRNEDQLPHLITRKSTRRPRRLIKIATADGQWHGKWTSDYVFSLEQLQLADLAEDGQKDAKILITLNMQKHAGFGFSVEGRIITSFTRKCNNCSSSYCREIDTTFDVWLLSSSRENRSSPLPEIGGDDPSVIYVKPGCEADLDSLIQDTIRLTTSVKETCSESCEKAEPRLHYIERKETSIDGRWSRLLELKKNNFNTKSS